MSFSEFCDIFTPQTHEYRKAMHGRVERSIWSFVEYTHQTQTLVTDLLKSIVTVEENFECNKVRMTDGSIINSDTIFEYLDKGKDGYVTFSELEAALRENGVKANYSDVKTLFEQFDRNKDGKITFEEFHSPVRERHACHY